MGLDKHSTSKGGGIKHIQRGSVSSGTKDGTTYTIPLSGFTNLDKMIVLLHGDAHQNNTSTYRAVYIDSVSLDKLVVSGRDYTTAFYQVIEFE